jgi:hypothetical protein
MELGLLGMKLSRQLIKMLIQTTVNLVLQNLILSKILRIHKNPHLNMKRKVLKILKMLIKI